MWAHEAAWRVPCVDTLLSTSSAGTAHLLSRLFRRHRRQFDRYTKVKAFIKTQPCQILRNGGCAPQFARRARKRTVHIPYASMSLALSGAMAAPFAPPLVPTLALRTTCPVVVIADTRKPLNQGFGARATFLMWAAHVAQQIGAVLAVDERFWSKGGARGFHFGNSFTWAWSIFPFANASYVLAGGPGSLTVAKKTYTVDELLKTWQCGHVYRLQAGQTWSCGEHARWCYLRLAGALGRSMQLVTDAATPKLRALWNRASNSSEPVLVVWHVRTGDITLPLRRDGAATLKHTIDHAFPRRGVRHVLLTFQRKELQKSFPWLSDLGLSEVLDGSVLPDKEAFELMLSAGALVSTGSSFPHIPAGLAASGRQIHFYLPPKNSVELIDGVCCLAVSDTRVPCTCEPTVPPNLLKDFGKDAGVRHHRVGGGSGGGVVHGKSSSTASRGRRLSAEPPCRPSNATGNSVAPVDFMKATSSFVYRLRTHAYWMGSFVRRNTVPVDCAGNIFVEYRHKLRELARGIDSERGHADEGVADWAYEGWMR